MFDSGQFLSMKLRLLVKENRDTAHIISLFFYEVLTTLECKRELPIRENMV
jgi:hypothetical protein